MTKQLKPVIIIMMLSGYISLGQELRSLHAQLDESMESWQKTAADKETLQVDLKARQKELNIAQLDLDDLTKDADEIKAEIEKLKSEILILKQSGSSGH